MQPTYFVKHPDGTFTEAEPQPLLANNTLVTNTNKDIRRAVIEIITEQKTASLNDLLIGIYKKTGVIKKRTQVIWLMTKMAKEKHIIGVKGEQGCYAIFNES